MAASEGETWLEVMLAKGVNDSEDELAAIAQHVEGGETYYTKPNFEK